MAQKSVGACWCSSAVGFLGDLVLFELLVEVASGCADDLRGLAAILGHSSLNTVMIYTEPTTALLSARMEKAETSRPEA